MPHNKKECEGCTEIKAHMWCQYKIFPVTYEEFAKHCPCTTCLVKLTCKENCEDRINMVKKHVVQKYPVPRTV